MGALTHPVFEITKKVEILCYIDIPTQLTNNYKSKTVSSQKEVGCLGENNAEN